MHGGANAGTIAPVNSDSLKYVLREFADRPLPECRPRELSLPRDSGKVIGLSGVRRCGKTFLFFDTIRQLVAGGVDRRRVVYLDFEDDRLQPVQSGDFDLVLRCLREVFPEAAIGRLYLFLDEVQSAPGWERWVRRFSTETKEKRLTIRVNPELALILTSGTVSRVRRIMLQHFLWIKVQADPSIPVGEFRCLSPKQGNNDITDQFK